MTYSLTPIGNIQSPYKEKFAVPRQPGLVPSAVASIALCDEANNEDAVRGIEQFSHLWVLFLFDQNIEQGWTPTVRPPRLGGNERIGVFASRATFRPNGIGMSVVPLNAVRKVGSQVFVDIGSCDLVDGTPIIDIKPYIPYSDSVSDAHGGYASDAPSTLDVIFDDNALIALSRDTEGEYKKQVIAEVLAQDPRPAYKKGKVDTKEYAVHLFNFNVKFTVDEPVITVTLIEAFGE
ncbi:tRNA (N6-threonylcarbamoyladenosine(37)-N6)-methyltransferase TrmO [Enterovibrio nigricans]|uniref:tRNA-Thr(GGU) m(6)t(6)A37 methyltransferase TsaA n=1 Tax=Enterovibrio nigricans DSM 22720 TaxID=1121868 RepID=A0A1T4UBF6_9GAMM|nr:tRNA (N6-threonylcarbamoyladenosine(37)-N6)-methyltransferase TrmO [Enterovibrio nigricans]PKF51459.1 tRNA (N6-threonylcarbamoyladenosine(37)-N6)-methyltransferase TrmO [Enterovibrio nigricans]SKA50102.1 tRNA-Thr(GGU) m(6)t(6)A37 methyltransferase TsaA [Enterovibrio nigricans DSM 22720]